MLRDFITTTEISYTPPYVFYMLKTLQKSTFRFNYYSKRRLRYKKKEVKHCNTQ